MQVEGPWQIFMTGSVTSSNFEELFQNQVYALCPSAWEWKEGLIQGTHPPEILVVIWWDFISLLVCKQQGGSSSS